MLLITPPPDQVHFMVSFSLQVYTLPYTPDSAEDCRNKTAEYYNIDINLCCSKCAPGTTESDVNCAPCPDGTFSDQHSYTQTCQHHTDCVSQRRGVLTYGTTTSNAVCGPKVSPPASPPTTMPTSGVIGGVIGGVILLLIISTIIYKKAFTGSRLVSSTEHVNGNCEAIKFDCDGPMILQNSSFITSYQEQQQCLLGKGNCIYPSQAENQQDARRTRVLGCSNILEGLSIGPLQSTPPPSSTQSSTNQPSPQPISPQPISPLPSSPLVNVNITVNYPIGNGSCSTPTSTHIDSSQADSELPLSREEEVYVNMPQQEGGKEALQESGNDV
ncbi:unnamed protein product [Coregonus sp. 'balchen']|nr:unnamed protein product [Coregonus sp. 'balchen']